MKNKNRILSSLLFVCLTLGISTQIIFAQGRQNALTLDQIYSFESKNNPGQYIRHQNSWAIITSISSKLDTKDASFKVVQGLAGDFTVSFESVNYPGYYLRHQNAKVRLDQSLNSGLYKKDASFKVVPGLADPAMVSFESLNYPNYFLRNEGGKLILRLNSTDRSFNNDATFRPSRNVLNFNPSRNVLNVDPSPSVVADVFTPNNPVPAVVTLKNSVSKRYLFSSGDSVTQSEGGWTNSPPVLGTDANYYNMATWEIIKNSNGTYFLKNVVTKRYLFASGEAVTQSEGGWTNSPTILGTDANYYNRAYWEITKNSNGTYLLKNPESKRYLFSGGEVPTQSEGGWTNSPTILGTDANYYDRAYWEITGSGVKLLDQ